MNGIGGRTVEEAKERLSYVEFLAWAAYRKKRGSLNANQHIERAGALVATILSNVNRKKDTQPFSFYDFAPHHEEPPISLEKAMDTWH